MQPAGEVSGFLRIDEKYGALVIIIASVLPARLAVP